MPICGFVLPDGTTCKQEFKKADAARLLRNHKAKMSHWPNPSKGLHARSGDTSLDMLAGIATNQSLAAPEPALTPAIPSLADMSNSLSIWNRSIAELPTDCLEIIDPPKPGSPTKLCTEHVNKYGVATPGCWAISVPHKDSSGDHSLTDAELRSKYQPMCEASGKRLTAIIRYSDPDMDPMTRLDEVVGDLLNLKVAKLADPGSAVPPGLTIKELLTKVDPTNGTALMLATDPERWGIQTKEQADKLFSAIVGAGFKYDADLPGGSNDYLSQRSVVSAAEARDIKNGTQPEHTAALMFMLPVYTAGTGTHIDLFGPANNLPTGAAGWQGHGTTYMNFGPREVTSILDGWFKSLADANNDPYLKRVLACETPDLVGQAVPKFETKVACAYFPTLRQMAEAAKFGLPTHFHACTPGTSYAINPYVDHTFRNYSYLDESKRLVTPPKFSITYDWLGRDMISPNAQPPGLPANFTYTTRTKLDDAASVAFNGEPTLTIQYDHTPAAGYKYDPDVNPTLIMPYPAQLFIATSSVPKSGLGLWTSVSVPEGALLCEYTGTLMFGQDSVPSMRKQYPPSMAWDQRHTWQLYSQRLEREPANRKRKRSAPPARNHWSVLAINATDHGSGAGFVNSVFWKEYATNAAAEKSFGDDCSEFKQNLDEYNRLTALLKSQREKRQAQLQLNELRQAKFNGIEPKTPNVRAIIIFDGGNKQPRLFWQATRNISRGDELLCLGYDHPVEMGTRPRIKWPRT
jgi:hypothetical protein